MEIVSATIESMRCFFANTHLLPVNFRLDLPNSLAPPTSSGYSLMDNNEQLQELKVYDQLSNEKQRRTAFIGLHEGEFWKFKATYKCIIGAVDKYK